MSAEAIHERNYKIGVMDHDGHVEQHAEHYKIGVYDHMKHVDESHGYPFPIPNDPYGFPLSRTGIPIVQALNDPGTLGTHDVVGTTFWIATNAMLAFTVFFLVEMREVPKQWQRSVCVAALVCGVAFWNYNYMRDAWVYTQQSPVTYRYTDWLITVPMQIVEFYLILQAVTDVPVELFYKLLVASLVMLLSGWFGETGVVSVLAGFIPGMAGWLYIVYEVFFGECGKLSGKTGSRAGMQAFNTLRLIVSVGWTIYPIGYYLVYLGPTFSYHSESVVNIVYNIADFVNKGAFGLAIYSAACEDRF